MIVFECQIYAFYIQKQHHLTTMFIYFYLLLLNGIQIQYINILEHILIYEHHRVLMLKLC